MQKGRVAVFLSGRGTNFLALHKASLAADANYAIVLVISDRQKAAGLRKARGLGIPAHYLSPKACGGKEQFETEAVKLLREHSVELICLAGYMRIVGPGILAAFPNLILNIHPALLPSFPGLHAQKQALDHGVKVSGCTVHFVDSGTDTGPIILQKAVPLRERETEESLSRRILRQEHRIYPQAVRLFFANRLRLEGRRVIIAER